jgi:hypothetical protein
VKKLNGELLSRKADEELIDGIFSDINVNANQLNTENDYKNFGKKAGGVLNDGQAPYRIPAFFKEAISGVTAKLTSLQIKEILDNVTTHYNEKVKQEKLKDGKKAAPKKTAINAGKHTTNIVNN